MSAPVKVEDHRFAALVAIIGLTGLVVAGIMLIWCSPSSITGRCIEREDDISQLGILIAAAVAPFIGLITLAFRDYFRVTEEAIKKV